MRARQSSNLCSYSSEGKIDSLEEAINYFNSSPPFIGIKTLSGGVFIFEKEDNKIGKQSIGMEERTFVIDTFTICFVVGETNGAIFLIEQARLEALEYKKNHQEPMPLSLILECLSRYMQACTQYNFRYPYFTTLIISGWDLKLGFQIFKIDPSGTFSNWKALVIGKNTTPNQEILEDLYDRKISNSEALSLLFKIFYKKQDPHQFFEGFEIYFLNLDKLNNLLIKKLSYTDYENILSD